ncbi:related to nonmuscle myosin-II heavy chain [Phialocephala subalpina]|uniref:Related to nonmuscle myosin-II heavy chain n=1 Tax=Phialocephala subalpina TaxID=576137 RepID=A0A1L7WZ61_9HELO|nr:related to nonmuscle myosin-II heavy chain [Phialocephala subalpina]
MMNGAQRTKALPPRPSQDLGYGGMQNGYRKENVDPRNYGTQNGRKLSTQEPSGRMILQGYGNEISNGFEHIPRYNPSNPSRPQSSNHVNVNDPIQIHLLVETALGDSKEFEILSQEEVDDLKKQCQSLTQRIEQTRQSLAIQSKYRDAAISMGKLYTSADKKKSLESQDGKRERRSIFGHNRAGSDQIREAEQERMASERKCEELAAELWSLEKRLMDPQSRLLKHTAGILQMTHKGPKNLPKNQNGAPQVPGSPESMFTYSNARNSIEPLHDELFFDDRSLYKPADGFGDLNFGPPQKSDGLAQMQMIAQTEQRLDDLNSRLRAVIVKVNPAREGNYSTPPVSGTSRDGTGEMLQRHLEYLERSISTIDDEHTQAMAKSTQNAELNVGRKLQESQAAMERRLQESEAATERRLQESEAAMEETLEGLNQELRDLLLPYDVNRPEPPRVGGNGVDDQLTYFQDSLGALEMELSRAASNTSKNTSNQGSLEQMETVMTGLWEIIQSGDEIERQRKLERAKVRYNQDLPDDEEESDGDGGDPSEPFSLQGFSAKVQWLYAQATRLKDQKKVLQRQIKQQRELNNKSDATKDAEMMQKVEELERTKNLLTRTEMDADNVRAQLSAVMEKLDEARQQEQLQAQSRSNDENSKVRAAQAELDQKNQMIAALEEELQDMRDDQSIGNAELQGKIADSETKIATLTQELAAAAAAQATFEANVQAKEKEIADKEEEMENMNMEIARLQTEVTIARAELDGAYGSRAQRAAEVAANPVIQKEIDDLKEKNASLATELASLKSRGTADPQTDEKMKTLKKELEETIEEYEQMTKASIEWEKERESLEGTIDKLRDERERMEAELSDEKVRWLGMKSPGFEGGAAPGTTSTTVLKNEFKKMMRDTRAESAKALRTEQAERRRIEDELRALKKSMGPGRSPLSMG